MREHWFTRLRPSPYDESKSSEWTNTGNFKTAPVLPAFYRLYLIIGLWMLPLLAWLHTGPGLDPPIFGGKEVVRDGQTECPNVGMTFHFDVLLEQLNEEGRVLALVPP